MTKSNLSGLGNVELLDYYSENILALSLTVDNSRDMILRILDAVKREIMRRGL